MIVFSSKGLKLKKILFICSHLHSGSNLLFECLNLHPRIQGYKFATIAPYSNPLNLINLSTQKHKLNNRSSIHMDELLYNHQLSIRCAYKECKFIYVVKEPTQVLNCLISIDKMNPLFAARYYTYRLRRLCEMAKRTSNAVLLTGDDLLSNRGMNLIEEYLGLKQNIEFKSNLLIQKSFSNNLIPLNLRSSTENAYQKYLFFLKNQNIKYV